MGARFNDTSRTILSTARSTMRMILITLRLRCNVRSVFRCLKTNCTSFLVSVPSGSSHHVHFLNGTRSKNKAFPCLNGAPQQQFGNFNEGHLCKISSSSIQTSILSVSMGLFRKDFTCSRTVAKDAYRTINARFRLTNAFFTKSMRSTFFQCTRCNL